MERIQSVDALAGAFFKSVTNVLERSTKKKISHSKTVQKVQRVSLRPDVGCFVQFSGDYSGLVVINFTAEAALELYSSYMTAMGIPENELVKNCTSNEVPDTIGELTNQIMGRTMSMVEDKYDLSSLGGQPRALALNTSIILQIDTPHQESRRLVFSVSGFRFYVELAMEKNELFIL